jgi:hypothetical protein
MIMIFLAVACALCGVPVGLMAGWDWGILVIVIGAALGAFFGYKCLCWSEQDPESDHYVR